jgi:tetratricopeptide (TPR) repeat protein
MPASVIELAHAYYEKNNFPAALDLLNQQLNQQSSGLIKQKDGEWLYDIYRLKVLLARAYFEQNNLAAALDALDMFDQQLDERSGQLVNKESKKVLGEIDRQIESLKYQSAQQPKDQDLVVRIARLEASRGNIWHSASLYKEAYSLQRSDDALEEFRTLMHRTDSKPLVFVHIPKTAGTTVNDSLAQSFMKEEIYSIKRDWKKSVDQLNSLDDGVKKYVHGHIPLSVLNQITGKFDVVTLLRNPVELVVSTFMHIKRSPQHPLYSQLNEEGFSLVQFLSLHHPSFQPNSLTSILGRDYSSSASDKTDDNYWTNCVAQAKKNIKRHNVVVGFQDNLPKFYDAITSKNRLQIHHKTKSFLVTPDKQRITPSTEELAAINKACRYDLELYEYLKSKS